jgi:hypothetical protein
MVWQHIKELIHVLCWLEPARYGYFGGRLLEINRDVTSSFALRFELAAMV